MLLRSLPSRSTASRNTRVRLTTVAVSALLVAVGGGAGTASAQALPAGSVELPAGPVVGPPPTADEVLGWLRAALPAQFVPAQFVPATGSLGATQAAPPVYRDVSAGLGQSVNAEVNSWRAAHGLRGLGEDPALTAEADGWARDLAARDVVEHNRGALGRGLGENIVAAPPGCNARCLVDLWKASPGHNENLLDPAYRVSGIGVGIGRGGKVFVVQNFR